MNLALPNDDVSTWKNVMRITKTKDTMLTRSTKSLSPAAQHRFLWRTVLKPMTSRPLPPFAVFRARWCSFGSSMVQQEACQSKTATWVAVTHTIIYIYVSTDVNTYQHHNISPYITMYHHISTYVNTYQRHISTYQHVSTYWKHETTIQYKHV